MEMLPEPQHIDILYKISVDDVVKISIPNKELVESVFDVIVQNYPKSKVEIWEESNKLTKQVVG